MLITSEILEGRLSLSKLDYDVGDSRETCIKHFSEEHMTNVPCTLDCQKHPYTQPNKYINQ